EACPRARKEEAWATVYIVSNPHHWHQRIEQQAAVRQFTCPADLRAVLEGDARRVASRAAVQLRLATLHGGRLAIKQDSVKEREPGVGLIQDSQVEPRHGLTRLSIPHTANAPSPRRAVHGHTPRHLAARAIVA